MNNIAPNEQNPFDTTSSAAKGGLTPLSRALLILGFLTLVIAGLFLFLYGNQTLHFGRFAVSAAMFGRYLLGLGLVFYVAGRALYYARRFKARRQNF